MNLARARLAAATAAAVTIGAWSVAAQSKPAPDFAAARDEVAQTLSGLVRIDTSNPPGHETLAANYLKAILDREGIASEIIEGTPGRGNLIARLKGSGRKRPVLLMGHLDVVGVERDKWSVDPFGGDDQGRLLYGRGASDDKGMTSACFETFLLLHRLKVPLDRDVIFLAEADEEAGGRAGIDFLVKNHWDEDRQRVRAERGRIHLREGRHAAVRRRRHDRESAARAEGHGEGHERARVDAAARQRRHAPGRRGRDDRQLAAADAHERDDEDVLRAAGLDQRAGRGAALSRPRGPGEDPRRRRRRCAARTSSTTRCCGPRSSRR